jgi:hypothetical protein
MSDDGEHKTVSMKLAMSVLTTLLAVIGGLTTVTLDKATQAAEARAENAVMTTQVKACGDVMSRSEKLLAALEASR